MIFFKSALKKTGQSLLFSGGLSLLLCFMTAQAASAHGDLQPVTFQDNPDPVPARGVVHYTIDVHNNSATDVAVNPTMTMTVPNGFTFVSVNDADCSYTGSVPSDGNGTVDCNWANLAADSSYDIDIELRASDTMATYSLTATATCDNDENDANESSHNNTDVSESADLILTGKGSSPEDTINAGGILTYIFEVQNDGPNNATSLTLNDALPIGLTFLADNANPAADNDASWDCSAVNQNVTCNSASLANGATSIFYFRVKVTADTTGDITNSASITSTTPEPIPDNNTATDDIQILVGTDMSIAKSVDSVPVISGQPAQFTLTATNEGPMTADNVEVTDTLPTGYTGLTIVSTPAGWACSISALTITCSNPSVPASEIGDIVFTAIPPAVNGVVVHTNSATVSTTTTDPISSNDTDSVNYTVTPDIADLALTKSKSPTPVALNSDIGSTINVANNGPRAADPVQVVDVLSTGESFVGFTGTNWACTHSGASPGGTVTCDYSAVPLAANASAAPLYITTNATNAGDLANTACTGGSGGSLEPGEGDSIDGNNCNGASSSSTTEIADIQVTKTTDDAHIIATENSFTYTIAIHNNGGDTAKVVAFTDIVPQWVAAGLGGRPATTLNIATTQGTCTQTNALVECNLLDIPDGDTVTVSIEVIRPMKEGTYTNRASAYSTITGDNDRSNNSNDAEVQVTPVTDIEVTSKSVTYSNHPDPILAGTIATYTIQVRNNGPSEAETVTLDDIFTGGSADFTYISSNVAGGGTCTWDAGTSTVDCALGDMAAHTTKSITVQIRPTHSNAPPNPWEIENTATVDMVTQDSDDTNNEQTLTMEIQTGQSDLAVEKSESPDFIEPVHYKAGTDNYLVYEVVVSNRGPSLATGVSFVDNVISVSPHDAEELRFVRDTINSDGTDDAIADICVAPGTNPFPVDGTLQGTTCTLPNDLESGTSYTHYLVFEILDEPHAISGDVYHNDATVSGNEPDANAVNDTEGEDTTVRTETDLGLVKTGPDANVEVEEHFNMTITVTNHGPGTSVNPVVTDNLPAGMVLTDPPTGVNLTCTGITGSTSFSCTLDTMADGDTRVINVPVKLTSYPAGGTITNSASVSGPGPEPSPDNVNPNTDDHTVPVHQPATLGNYVWLDADGDGIQDGSESGISGVTVNLLDDAGGFLATTTTNGSGAYSFSINSSGDYIVEFVNPNAAVYIPSPQSQGADNTVDSDAATNNGRTAAVTINYGDSNQTIDAGFYQQVSLGDRVWMDDNANGTQDAGELGIPGVTIRLLDDILVVIATTTTDINGNYEFTGLEPGDYSVQITPPTWPGYFASPVQIADPDTDINTDSNIDTSIATAAGTFQSGVVTLTSEGEPSNDGDDNNTNSSIDFGLVLPGSVGNIIWLDENSNGIQNAGEAGIANITVQLKDSNGTVIATTKTDTEGGYLFTDLPPGEYFIAVDTTTLPVGMSQTTTYPNPGADFTNQNQSVGHGYSATVTSGGENLTADFGYNWSPTTDVTTGQNTGALGDRIWIDTNGDGVQDSDETGVSGAEVTLRAAGPDGIFGNGDDVLTTTTTDSAGNYIFDDLAANSYIVEVTDSSAASHDILNSAVYSQTGDPDHFADNSSTAPAGTAGDNKSTNPIILAPGDTFINADFGYRPQPAANLHRIGNIIWLDANRDGVIDASEARLPGVTIALQNAAGDYIATSTTDGTGEYIFTDLPDGQYTVVVTDTNNILGEFGPTWDKDNLLVNPDNQSTLTLNGADNLEQHFGYIPNSPNIGTGMIGDTIFLDRDNDGIVDPGEGMEGIHVILHNQATSENIATTTTDANGLYYFAGLPAGDYTVAVETTTLPSGVSNTADPDGGLNSTSNVTLAAGEINLVQDFGYFADTPATLGNLLWKDTNADGVYQANGVDGTPGTADDETPFEGILIDLYRDTNGNGIIDANEPKSGTTATDSNGNYLFSNLPGGNYNVKVNDVAGTLTGFWHSTGTVNTNNNSQANPYSVTLPNGGSILTADFGYYAQPGNVGDRVFVDVDVNGLYNTGDTALSGITVFMDILYPDGSTVTLQTVTDSDGLYVFPNLLLDENYNGIGASYGNGGDEPSHTVRIDSATIPAGITSIYASRGSNTDTTNVGGNATDGDDQDPGSDNPAGEVAFPPMGGSDLTNDFGYFVPGSIGDTIWHDEDNDGQVDAGEALSGVTVSLTPPADIDLGNGLGVAITTATDGSGNYNFPDLPPGDYTITVDVNTLPALLQASAINTVDPDGGNDSTAALSLTAGQSNVDQDFAYFVPSSIGDYVWDDTNGNGIQDGSESGHEGIRVHLLDINGNPVDDPSHPDTPYILTTGANGEYLFNNLIPGTYQVQFVLPGGIFATTQNKGADAALDSDSDPNGLVTGIILAINEHISTIDLGLTGAGIHIEKSTNTVDADSAPGVSLDVNDPTIWTYRVTNTGNVELTNVTVTDDKLGAISCPEDTLATGAFMVCTANGTAVVGQYSNLGSVIASPPTGPAITDSDPSYYMAIAAESAIDIEKSTNGVDADNGTGPIINIGNTVNWSYRVSNVGDIALTDIVVTDNMGLTVTCPQSTLAIGESISCNAIGIAVAGQYENIGSVSGIPQGGGTAVTDSDYSHYFGSDLSHSPNNAIHIEKSTNGQDADLAPGSYIEIGTAILWSYQVTNIGDTELSNVTITDDLIAPANIHCPNDGNLDNRITSLPVGVTTTCTASGTATAGAYQNTGSVVATPPAGPDINDTDPSNYFGIDGSIRIEKSTNGQDADLEPGPSIRVNDDVTWIYEVTNTGLFPLTQVTVTDDQGVAVSCPSDSLAAGATMECSGSDKAIDGQYMNVGSVTAVTPNLATVQDVDPSHYYGKSFNWALFFPALIPRCPPIPDFCYLVADGDNMTSTNSPLFKYTFETDSLELLNRLGVDNVETITLSLDGKTIYAADNGVFGIINPTPGIGNSFTPIEPKGVGLARGALGIIDISDIDGMSFDPVTKILYASVRNGDGQPGELDLLIQINPQNGLIIDNAFGEGIDYVIINTASENASDVDDIAIDSDGTLFGIAGNSGGGGEDQLVKINKLTGAVGSHGPLNHYGAPIQDMEGLTLYNTKVLYGTTGYGFTSEGTDNTLYKIDKASGKTIPVTHLNQDFNGYIPGDFEAITCFPICK